MTKDILLNSYREKKIELKQKAKALAARKPKKLQMQSLKELHGGLEPWRVETAKEGGNLATLPLWEPFRLATRGSEGSEQTDRNQIMCRMML